MSIVARMKSPIKVIRIPAARMASPSLSNIISIVPKIIVLSKSIAMLFVRGGRPAVLRMMSISVS